MVRILKRYISNLYNEYKLRRELATRFPNLEIEQNISFKGSLSNLKISGKVIIQSNTVIHLGGMDWCEKKGSLIIGNGSCISPNVVIYACGPHGVRIGENFDCGPGCGIFSSRTNKNTDGQRTHSFAPVSIGANVTLFSNVVVSPGVTIGDGAVIGAGSVVTKDIPAWSVAYGCPAKVVKSRKDDIFENRQGT